MNTKSPAGSATGIDLDALEQLAREAEDGDYKATEALNDAANPATVLALIALARATPQHPDAPADGADVTFGDDRHVDRIAQRAANEILSGWDVSRPKLKAAIVREVKAAINMDRAATPQHSVTEQASIDVNSAPAAFAKRYVALLDKNRALEARVADLEARATPVEQAAPFEPTYQQFADWCERHDMKSHLDRQAFEDAASLYLTARAQPLASTAATQPEQASIEKAIGILRTIQREVPKTLGDVNVSLLLEDIGNAEKSLRAALAIPASTAASEQQASVDAARYRYLRDHQDEGVEFRDGDGKWRADCPTGEELDSIIDAALSGRATIPSEADGSAASAFEEAAKYMETRLLDRDLAIIIANELRALTHRATTATRPSLAERFGGMDYARTPATAPDIATTAADQQGDEAERQNLSLVIARLEQIKHIAEDFDVRTFADEALACANALAQQGAAQAQAGDARAPDGWVAVALICGEPTSVAFRDQDAARAVCIDGVPFPFVRVSTQEGV